MSRLDVLDINIADVKPDIISNIKFNLFNFFFLVFILFFVFENANGDTRFVAAVFLPSAPSYLLFLSCVFLPFLSYPSSPDLKPSDAVFSVQNADMI